jgi:hypothetical protein
MLRGMVKSLSDSAPFAESAKSKISEKLSENKKHV